MSLVHLEDIWKAYGAKPVLNGISWQIDPGDRIGLIGRNGCGKTTLFHLIAGRLSPDRGRVHRQRGLNIGYLSQDPELEGASTVMQTALEAFRDLLDLQDRLKALEGRMASGNAVPDVLEQYGRFRDRYEQAGGYALEARVKAILHGLGFEDADLDLQVAHLSGGQVNRLALARLLAQKPDLLLLDEPTNHLDLQAIEWLEDFLDNYEGAFVLVSHDRYFLDRTAHKTVELERGQLARYPGNYTFYAAEKSRRLEQQRKAYEQQQAHIEKTEEFIRRNIAGQKTKQAQSRRKALEKLRRIDRPRQHRDLALNFASGARGGNRVLEAENLSKTYGRRTLFRGLDLVLRRGDRLGIIGPNGSGKSTLLKLLIGRAPPDTGRATLGRNISVGYYDQARQGLNPGRTVLEEVWSVTPQAPVGEIRNFLGAFLFSGDDIEQQVGSLSGGEQSRVALARLVRSQVNLLVLDEPTNHLDIPSRMVLETALDAYDGSFVAVSHDRYFLNRLINRLLVLGHGSWQIVEGNYEAFQRQHAVQTERPEEEPRDRASRRAAYETARRANREQERLKRRIGQVEQEIADLEAEMERLEGEMEREDLQADWERLQEISRERSGLQAQIDKRFAEWETLEAELAETGTE